MSLRTAVNEVTGDKIQSRAPSDKYKSGWDLIWGDKKDADGLQEQKEKETVQAEAE